MDRKRIVVETTEAAKGALTHLLADTRLTFSDWLDAKLGDEVATYEASPPQTTTTCELDSLESIKDAQRVIARLHQIDWSFKLDATGYLSHSLHPYPAKFIPQIPGTLISALTLPGELVWDPFGGSGTTALEAVLRQRRAISSDANPLAKIIGEAKTTTLNREDDGSIAALRERVILLSAQPDILAVLDPAEREALMECIPQIPNISEWFHEHAIQELAVIKLFIRNLPVDVLSVAKAAFSKIILKASYQDSETRYARKPKPVPVGSILRAYAAELGVTASRVHRLGTSLRFRKPSFVTSDVRDHIIGECPPAFLSPESVALIVTSPPYPNANDYHLYHRFRLFWLGYDPRELARVEIGSHLRHQKENSDITSYLADMRLCLRNCYLALQAGRYAALVVGDCVYNGKIYRTSEHLAEVARSEHLKLVGVIHRLVHSTKRSFIPAGRRTSAETILLFQKRARAVTVTLEPPSYKPWAYEESLRKREAEALLGGAVRRGSKNELTISIDAYQVNRLKQLAFTHHVQTSGCGRLLTWQAALENGDAVSKPSRKDPKYVTHGVHPFKGKFYPQLAKALFNLAGLQPGETVLDPYCGSGTVLLEAQVNGLRAYGGDINPLAVRMANAKCSILLEDPVIVDRALASFVQRLKETPHALGASPGVFHLSTLAEIHQWFPGPVVDKLNWCLSEITQIPIIAIKEFLRICLSSIVREVSQQDPKDLRIRRRRPPLTDAPVLELLAKKVQEQRLRLREFASKIDRCPHRLFPANAFICDSRNRENLQLALSNTDGMNALVTSPPYATALPYIDTDRLSLLILEGLTARQRTPLEKLLIGSREISKRERENLETLLQDSATWREVPSRTARGIVAALYKNNSKGGVGFRRLNMSALVLRYFKDMATSLRNVAEFLSRGASIFIVIGDNKTVTPHGEIVIRTTAVLREIGEQLGWKVEDQIPITVTKENLRHTRNSITQNTILWFKKR